MLKKLCLVSIAVFTLTIVYTSEAKAQDVSLDYFYDQLSPYGHWDNVDPYGWVWQPYNIYPGWRPYSDGYWVYTEYGWTYQADNNWGWAAYHYGRWTYLNSYGWVWVPGTEWAPAWVAWRTDDDYIGWAPLPPQVEWRAGVGLHTSGFNIDVDINWSNWCFVDVNHFDDPRVRVYIQGPARNVTFVRRTHNITRYEFANQRIINRCIDPDHWQHMSHRPVVRYNVIDAPSYQRVGIDRRPDRPEVRIYRPQFHSEPSHGAPRQIDNHNDLSSTRKYDKERREYDRHYDKEYHKLVEDQHRDEAAPNRNKEDLQQQHQAEMDAYRQQRNRETQTLENRHVNDMDKAVRQNPSNNNKGNSQPARKDSPQRKDQNSNNQQQDQQQSRRR
ncbi:MAG TPA: DUF6600 domain-containing protein [Bacteroidales bacterium]